MRILTREDQCRHNRKRASEGFGKRYHRNGPVVISWRNTQPHTRAYGPDRVTGSTTSDALSVSAALVITPVTFGTRNLLNFLDTMRNISLCRK